MDLHNRTCPTCQKSISPKRCFGNTAICECGWTKDLSSEAKKYEYNLNVTSVILVTVATFISLSFIHIVNWDNHFIAIIPLKTKQILGVADISQLKQIETICMERKKWNCVIDTYNNIYEQDPNQIESLHKLGRIYVSLDNNEAAVTTYQKYFEQGGADIDAHYEYAKSLGQVGKIKESTLQYQIILNSQSNTLQTTVTKSYVGMLMTHRMWLQAKEVIEDYRKRSRSGKFFMEPEMKKINDAISHRMITSS